MRRPSTSRTSTLPSRSRATATVSRSKNAASRILPEGAASGTVFDSCFADLPASGLAPALVHVERLVGHLVHGLPVHARLPGCDPHAELDRHRNLFQAVQVLERLAHAGAHLARVALVSLWHRDAELVAAEAPAGVRRPHRPLELVGEHPDRLIPNMVAERVVDLLEVVEVEHHQGKPPTVPRRGRDSAVDRPLELGT